MLDTRGALRCVRFESGNVGVVNTQGKTLLVTGAFLQLSFAENGFLRVFNRRTGERRAELTNERERSQLAPAIPNEEEEDEAGGREFFIDMKNGELYAQMPEFVHFGDFEIANIGGYLCTRTKKLYEVKAIPAEAWHGKYGLYLSLPFSGEPEDEILMRMECNSFTVSRDTCR